MSKLYNQEGIPTDSMNKMQNIRILGMMSGTSGDGIDGALVEFDETGNYKLLWSDSWNYSDDIFKRINSLMTNSTVEDILFGSDYVGILYHKAISAFLSRNVEKPDYIAAHGQTIIHRPNPKIWDGLSVSGSLQILNGSRLAEESGYPVICNFRERDLVVGGQGAPLVPYGDLLFFEKFVESNLLVLNIGGIANLTLLRKLNGKTIVETAFDTGPGNMLMDGFMQMISKGKKKYDRDGEMASKGQVCQEVFSKFMTHPYFKLNSPKTTGRSEFGYTALKGILSLFSENESNENIMATLLEITVESIVGEILKLRDIYGELQNILIAGGGALNKKIMERLQERICFCSVKGTEGFGVPVMSREAMAFAALGYAFLNKISANVSTGANERVVLGTKYEAGSKL